LLAKGKVTVDEADQLLAALGERGDEKAQGSADAPSRPRRFKFLRVNVHREAREGRPAKDVNIRVPASLVRGGMRLSALVMGTSGRFADRVRAVGLDDPMRLDEILEGLGESGIVIEDGTEQIRVTPE
jgi:hypothetical protein